MWKHQVFNRDFAVDKLTPPPPTSLPTCYDDLRCPVQFPGSAELVIQKYLFSNHVVVQANLELHYYKRKANPAQL